MQREMNDSLKATINPTHTRLPRLHRGRNEEMMAGHKEVNITIKSVVTRMKAGTFRAGIQGSFLTVSEELASFANKTSGASGSKAPSMMPAVSLERVSEERMSQQRSRVQFSESESMVNSMHTILGPESPSSTAADFLPLPSQQHGCGAPVVNTARGDDELNLLEVPPQSVSYTDVLGQQARAEIASDSMQQGSFPKRPCAPTTQSREPPPDDEANYVRQPGQSGHLRGQRLGSSQSVPAFSAPVQSHFTM
jgi:hypothetical protein